MLPSTRRAIQVIAGIVLALGLLAGLVVYLRSSDPNYRNAGASPAQVATVESTTTTTTVLGADPATTTTTAVPRQQIIVTHPNGSQTITVADPNTGTSSTSTTPAGTVKDPPKEDTTVTVTTPTTTEPTTTTVVPTTIIPTTTTTVPKGTTTTTEAPAPTTTTTRPPVTTTTTQAPPAVPLTPGTPSAVSRVQSARLLYSKVTGDVKEYQWNATVVACCANFPATGWHTVPADNILDLHSWGSGGAGHFSFQIRACNSVGVCGSPSGFSESVEVYHQPDMPKPSNTGTPTVTGGTVTWSWWSQIGFGITKPDTFTPSIAYFTVYLWDKGILAQPTVLNVTPQAYGQPGAVAGTYTRTFPLDGASYTFEVFPVSVVDGVSYTGPSAFFNTPAIK